MMISVKTQAPFPGFGKAFLRQAATRVLVYHSFTQKGRKSRGMKRFFRAAARGVPGAPFSPPDAQKARRLQVQAAG